ncbi:MAG: PAS domain S-box protein [Methanofollis sp.]|uniref:PAS domain S-box protein n=1 Tax=Methanofollis sp. TaxID=2052835 RepID=UPI00260B65C9|nr:PAS domain S-box protein [Methanofollis sp.]MDD4254891.1 PAS domain S-box protein [Methanofollis sp.]
MEAREEQDTASRILRTLRLRPRGMTITEVAKKTRINRNSVSKHLEVLRAAGQVDAAVIGNAKVYSIAQRVPLSSFLCFTRNMILVLDSAFRIVQVNDRFLDLAGVEKKDVVGLRIEDAPLPVVSDEDVLKTIREVGREQVHTEASCRLKERETFFSMQVIPTVFDDGERGCTVVLEDITGRKEYERALHESEAKFRTIVQDLTEPLCRFLPGGGVTFVNRAFCETFDFGEEDLAGTTLWRFIPPSLHDGIRKKLCGLGLENAVCTLEIPVVMPSTAETRWFSWTIRAIVNGEATLREYQGTGTDITAARHLEEKKRQYLQKMEFLARTAMEFVNLPPGADIYALIARRISELVPGAGVSVLSYDEDDGRFSLRALMDERFRAEMKEVVGEDVIGMSFPFVEVFSSPYFEDIKVLVDKGTADYLLSREPGDGGIPLSAITVGRFPEEVCREIVNRADLGRACMFALLWDGQLFGNIAIFLRRDRELRDREVVYSFVKQASIALNRQFTGERLHRSERRLRDIVDLLPYPVSIISRDGQILFLNRKFTAVFGYTLHDIPDCGAWFRTAFPDPAEREKAVRSWTSDLDTAVIGEVGPRFFRVRCRDGETKAVLFRPAVLSDGTRYVTCEDVSEAERVHGVLLAEIAGRRGRGQGPGKYS